jgi:hypothetical protein
MTYSNSDSTTNGSYAVAPEFAERVRNKQARLTSAFELGARLYRLRVGLPLDR